MERRWPRRGASITALVLVVGGVLAGCGGDSERGSPAPAPRSASGAPAQSGPSSCEGFRGATTPRASAGETSAGLLTEASAGADGCLDRVEFTFRPTTQVDSITAEGLAPGYDVQYVDSNRFTDGGVAVSIPGSAWLSVKIKPAASFDTTVPDHPVPTYLGKLLLTWKDYHHLQVVRKLADSDGSVLWVISLDAKRPFTVDAARDPTRISIYIG